MSFVHSSDFTIEGGTFNHIQGNQVNITRILSGKKKKLPQTPYDEYLSVPTGDLRLLREIHRDSSPRPRERNRDAKEEERIIYAVKLHRERAGSVFTAVQYTGSKATQAWKKILAAFQEHGLNRSKVPWLIFHGELVPVAHVWDRTQTLGKAYIYTVARTLKCTDPFSLWLDPERGTVIRGLKGPKWPSRLHVGFAVDVPLSVDFLQGQIFRRYLSQLPLNRQLENNVVHTLGVGEFTGYEHEENIRSRPTILSDLTSSIIAVGPIFWQGESNQGCLGDAQLISDGTTRFCLQDCLHSGPWACPNVYICPNWWDYQEAWLSQASSLFHKCGISLDQDLSKLYLESPWTELLIPIERSHVKCERRRNVPQIYLFVLPTPPIVGYSRICRHFWSFDRKGRTRMSKRKCRSLGLPTVLRFRAWIKQVVSWPTETYKNIHQWQLDRGFDPTTTDLAQYIGYPAWKVIQPKSSRLEQFQDDKTAFDLDAEDLSLDTFFYDTQVQERETSTTVQNSDKEHYTFWSALTAPFSWAAVEGLEIPAIML
ncbi:hypothetical protein E1B28_009439 [Marasmius oreades]|uniref:Uncharacterized protein n=1 Tax=Marasmius oreades TaxID=181124 RepID=A0A9P7S120_9AGAR|nr:uncharacterized protein E1B28_009439 [Marasmius oreades]KAG7093157.1 hypothetical protein E1B28_009439 [Marasmius oreades]